MATYAEGYSGWTGGAGQFAVFRLRGVVERTGVSIENNTSTVRMRFWVESGNGSFNYNSSHSLWFDGANIAAWSENRSLGTNSSILVADATRTITHNADGTRTVGAGFIFSNAITGTINLDVSLTLDQIPRATDPTWSGNFEAGAAKTITLNRASTSFTHDVAYTFGSVGYTNIGTGVGTSVSWTPPLSLLQQIPNATSGTGTIRVITKSGTTTIGTKTKTFTLTAPASAVPTVSQVLWDDDNTTVKTNIGAFVQNLSLIKGAVTASGYEGSTITTERVVVSGSTIPEGTAFKVTTSGTITASGEAVDSRGRVGSLAANFGVLAYTPPAVSTFSVYRTDSSGVAQDDGANLRMLLNTSTTGLTVGGVQKNSLTITVRTKPVSSGTWTTRNTINAALSYSTPVQITGGAVYLATTSYDVEVTVADKTGSSYVVQTTVPTGSVTLDMNGTNVGVGKFHENGKLDVAGDIYSSGAKVSVQGHTHTGDDLLGVYATGTLDPEYRGGGMAKVKINGTLTSSALPWMTPYLPNKGREVKLLRLGGQWHIAGQTVDGEHMLSLSSSFVPYSHFFNNHEFDGVPRATKLPSGLVVLSGLIRSIGSTAAGHVIATLPEGFRPDRDVIYPLLQADMPRAVDIRTDGTIRVRAGWAADQYASLDGIMFWTSGTPWQTVGTGGVTLNTTNFNIHTVSQAEGLRYYKDQYGFVWFDGVVELKTALSTNNTVIISLPTTHRSFLEQHFGTVGQEGFAQLGAQPTNGLVWKTGSPAAIGNWISLNGAMLCTSDGWNNNPWWNKISYSNSWVRTSASFPDVSALVREDGLRTTVGLVSSGTLTQFVVSLPQEFQPEYGRKIFHTTQSNALGRINLASKNNIVSPYLPGNLVPSMGGNGFYSFDGLGWIP